MQKDLFCADRCYQIVTGPENRMRSPELTPLRGKPLLGNRHPRTQFLSKNRYPELLDHPPIALEFRIRPDTGPGFSQFFQT